MPSELPATRLARSNAPSRTTTVASAITCGGGPGSLSLAVPVQFPAAGSKSRVSVRTSSIPIGTDVAVSASESSDSPRAFSVRSSALPVMAGRRRLVPEAAPSRDAKVWKIVSIRGSAAIRKRPGPSVVTVAVPWIRISLSTLPSSGISIGRARGPSRGVP